MNTGQELAKTIQSFGCAITQDFNYNWLPDAVKDSACRRLLELSSDFQSECIPGVAMWPNLGAMYLQEPEAYCQRLRNYLLARALIYSADERCSIEEALIADADILSCEATARLEYNLPGFLYLLFKDQANFLILCQLAAVKYLNTVCEDEINSALGEILCH